MFTHNQLKGKSLPELKKILKDLKIQPTQINDLPTIIFDIIDYQATHVNEVAEYYKKTEQPDSAAAENPAQEATPKRRGRKKKTETAPTEENAAPAVESTPATAAPAEVSAEATVTPAPKRRGRKPKNAVENSAASDAAAAPQEVTAETPKESPAESTQTQPNQNQRTRDTRQTRNRENQQNRNPREQTEDNQPQPGNTVQEKQTRREQQAPTHSQNQNQENPETETKKDFNFDGLITIEGVMEILPDNYGFLRSPDFSYISSPDDVYVSTNQIRNYGLKTGDTVKGIVRLPKEGEKYFSLQKPLEVNGRDMDFIKDRVAFEHLTPLFPEEKFNLAGKGATPATRIVDMFAPIGKGQRAMIVAQPKTGKTMLLKDIANAISANHPEAYMMVLLIDERPEEVTDMERSVNAEVIASTFDEAAEKHVKVANLVLAKAQRLVECGHDVVILLDSITRLARAYNTVTPASGKILSGGVDANALHRPKRFFGAARNIEGGGSLTIIATALIDTGSRMDEVIFEEFKGTGNMELQLDRRIANKRIFPAIDLVASSTRKDDLLLDPAVSQRMWILRKHLSDMNPVEAMEFVDKHIRSTVNNQEFLMSMNK